MRAGRFAESAKQDSNRNDRLQTSPPPHTHTSSSSVCEVMDAYFFNTTKMIKLILPAKKRRAAAGLRSECLRRSSRVGAAKSRPDASEISSSSTSFAVIFYGSHRCAVGRWRRMVGEGGGGDEVINSSARSVSLHCLRPHSFHLSSAVPALICHHLFFPPSSSFKAAVHPVEYSRLSSCMDDLILTPSLLCAGNWGGGVVCR